MHTRTFSQTTPTGAQYASAGALITRALGAVILRNDSTTYTKLNAAQAMLNTGCAALLGDAAGCTALLAEALQNEYKLIEHQAKLQRCAVQLCASPRNARSISAQLVDSRGLLHHPWDGKA